MATNKSVYVCNSCGYETAKWFGQCPSCGEWNTMEEQARPALSKSGQKREAGASYASAFRAERLSEITASDEQRSSSGINEFDRVLGGGLVKGSVVLLCGDPGIGKSTILLQVSQHYGREFEVLYISGEESAHQIKLRAERLNVTTENLRVLCETDVGSICEYIKSERPGLVIIDSIQTMTIAEINSYAGSVSQVRESTNALTRTAKDCGVSVIIVGHVNKDGNIAGPKVLEHIVDTVLYFEGERNLSYRILRAVKNRFGSTNEIGVFDMSGDGLREVPNPSQMMLDGRPTNASGSCVVCAMEGSRPILAEVQGLATPTGYGNPRRMATGFDYNRMLLLLAVLEKRAGYFFGNMDCYINVVGGLRIDEPASDLSVAMALISSLKDEVPRNDVLAFGEIGLAGEIRAVSNAEQRIAEAARLGFSRCVIPRNNLKHLSDDLKRSIEIVGVSNIRQAYEGIK
ncbi:MAG: DNA repair protein RadA [Clostridia bacterium]|nr:DNA repair protein RadA [Clostridia bacterium]MBQ9878958.1 DNA repair protein RadA [Clostridia bacterium]